MVNKHYMFKEIFMYTTDIKEKATKQAQRHAHQFWDENELSDILEKYAEVCNKKSLEIDKLVEREERGARILPEDQADFYYYEEYSNIFAFWIANSYLSINGYERDKNKNWILKKPAPISPISPQKKKFKFW